jgi:hypothetical protein
MPAGRPADEVDHDVSARYVSIVLKRRDRPGSLLVARNELAPKSLLICGITMLSCVAACGGGNDPEPGSSATSTTASSTSATVAVEFDDINKLADAMVAAAAAQKTARVKLDMVSAEANVTAEGAYRQNASGAEMQLTMTVPDGQVELINSGGATYLKLPGGQEFEPGKPWGKLSEQGSHQVPESFGLMATDIRNDVDVTDAAKDMKAAGKITRSSPEQVDGVDAIRYSISLDLAKLADATQDPAEREALRLAIESGLKEALVDLWVSSENLPLKADTGIVLENATSQPLSTMTYSDWGAPVTIEAPPADQVVDVSLA